MAYPTSQKGYFTITALSFTPDVIAMGETAQFSITIKNASGKSVKSCYLRMTGQYPSAEASTGLSATNCSVYLHGGPNFALTALSWASGVSKTFTGAFTFDAGSYAPDSGNYVLAPASAQLRLQIVTDATFADGTNYDNFYSLCGSDGAYLTVLSKRDNPRVSFDMARTPNDESTSVKTSIHLRSDVSDSVFTSHGYTAKLYRSSAHSPATASDTVTTLNCTIAQMLSGVTGSTTAVTTTFSNGSDWSFLLVVSNGYESQSAACSIPRAFANVHMSGCTTGGVAFGKFSAATENNPLFECVYPARFYGGVDLADGGMEELLLSFDADAVFTLRSDNPLQPTLRRFGHVVELHGEIQPTESISGSTTYYPICTLPAEYAPHHDVMTLQQGSSQSIWMLRVFRRDHPDTPCKVMLSRYRSGNAWASASTTAWLPFHVTWIV